MNTSMAQQPTDNNASDESAKSIVDSPHFTTVIVLKAFLKERLFDGKCDPLQDRAIANSLLHLIETENISLGNALAFVEAQPKPKPRSQRVLEDWWANTQKGTLCRKTL